MMVVGGHRAPAPSDPSGWARNTPGFASAAELHSSLPMERKAPRPMGRSRAKEPSRVGSVEHPPLQRRLHRGRKWFHIRKKKDSCATSSFTNNNKTIHVTMSAHFIVMTLTLRHAGKFLWNSLKYCEIQVCCSWRRTAVASPSGFTLPALRLSSWPVDLTFYLCLLLIKAVRKGRREKIGVGWGRRSDEGKETSGGVACKASLIRWWAVQCFSPDAYMH